MLNSVLGLEGVELLEKSEQLLITGSKKARKEKVTCSFPDGTGYELTYNNSQAAFLALDYCFQNGGTGTVEFL